MGVLDTLPATVGAALDFLMSDATLTPPGAAVADGRGGRTYSAGTGHSCRAILTEFSDFALLASAGVITDRDRKAVILASSLDVTPNVGDALSIGGETLEVMAVDTDPARATWTLRVRK